MAQTTKPLKELQFTSTLGQTLEEIGKTRNALAVEARVRPATINAIVDGSAKQLVFETLEAILEALHTLEPSRAFTIEDVVKYEK
ncbi:XRE family transcriptional regulator [Priestia megaterium]|uniref:XRE family transcriptional regulator n=1 Tax=Priestia megaterium TaxID=1404 RepID=UPI002E1C4DA4|nr:XRE family transcriptional regulator [Priestia megaterium]